MSIRCHYLNVFRSLILYTHFIAKGGFKRFLKLFKICKEFYLFLSLKIHSGITSKYHQDELAPAVSDLAKLEKQVQMSYLNFMKDWNTAV